MFTWLQLGLLMRLSIPENLKLHNCEESCTTVSTLSV
jgi:hypothetical protein